MADYTALAEAGSGLVELLRDQLTPEPISQRELIALCSPHEGGNCQMTVYLFHLEEDGQSGPQGYQPVSRDMERMRPTEMTACFLITAHSNAPAPMREADQYRMIGAAIQAVKDMPVLETRYLGGTLAESPAHLHLSIERPDLEQMMKLWNGSSAPYKLSIVVKISGIRIDSKRTRPIHRVTDVEIGAVQRKERRSE